MNQDDSLMRLEIMILVCQQLSEDESDRLMMQAIEDPPGFKAELIARHGAGVVVLPDAHLNLLRGDLGMLPVAV